MRMLRKRTAYVLGIVALLSISVLSFINSLSDSDENAGEESYIGRTLKIWYDKWKESNPAKYERYKKLDEQRKAAAVIRVGDQVVDHQLDQKNLEMEQKYLQAKGTEELVEERKKILRLKLSELEKVKTMDWQNSKDESTLDALITMRRIELDDAIERMNREQSEHEKYKEEVEEMTKKVEELLEMLEQDLREAEEENVKTLQQQIIAKSKNEKGGGGKKPMTEEEKYELKMQKLNKQKEKANAPKKEDQKLEPDEDTSSSSINEEEEEEQKEEEDASSSSSKEQANIESS